jgi:hypothetical protein
MDHEATTSPSERAAAVVHELETIEDVAIDHHVAAFELAHAKLRGLLTDEGHLSHQQPRAIA